jgi:hypothetical protein
MSKTGRDSNLFFSDISYVGNERNHKGTSTAWNLELVPYSIPVFPNLFDDADPLYRMLIHSDPHKTQNGNVFIFYISYKWSSNLQFYNNKCVIYDNKILL